MYEYSHRCRFTGCQWILTCELGPTMRRGVSHEVVCPDHGFHIVAYTNKRAQMLFTNERTV